MSNRAQAERAAGQCLQMLAGAAGDGEGADVGDQQRHLAFQVGGDRPHPVERRVQEDLS
jgi:hypothetical protein